MILVSETFDIGCISGRPLLELTKASSFTTDSDVQTCSVLRQI